MLYMVGTLKEIAMLTRKFPDYVIEKVFSYVQVLDNAYGADRDYSKVGGYCLIAETDDDVSEAKAILDYDNRNYEWRDFVGDSSVALYLLGDDYSIVYFEKI